MFKRIGAAMILSVAFLYSSFAQSGSVANNVKMGAAVKHRIVIQLASGDTAAWLGAVHNVRNLKTALGEDVLVELVAHGPAIDFLVQAKTTQAKAIAELKASGVVFAACANSMRARNIQKEALVSEAIVVPSGVAEVVLKEEDGWSYLKSGF